MGGHPLDQHIQCHHVAAAFGHDQIGFAFAGLHKLLVHRLNGGQVLVHHAVQRAAALLNIHNLSFQKYQILWLLATHRQIVLH